MSNNSETNAMEWEDLYRKYAPDRLPWERGIPDTNLVDLIKRGVIERGRVLDVCSGLGTQTIYLAKEGFEVYGIDISSTAVDMAKERCKTEGVICNLIAGDAVKLKYPDEFFTFIFDRGCFHSISADKREDFIRGIHRVLKKQGKYYMTCFNYKNGPAPNHFSKEDINQYFSALFNILSIKEEVFKDDTSQTNIKIQYFYVSLMEKK
jgi:ubiquinone/menaquinone biosynthesis C-methylase UbiE